MSALRQAISPTGFSRRAVLGWLAAAALPLRAAPSRLKITGFEIHKATLRWRDLVFAERTDGGITGPGEATLETRAKMVQQKRGGQQQEAGFHLAAMPADSGPASQIRGNTLDFCANF